MKPKQQKISRFTLALNRAEAAALSDIMRHRNDRTKSAALRRMLLETRQRIAAEKE